ncbi:MAG: SulP family inorganic anion transporter, partial [Lautropia sp.]
MRLTDLSFRPALFDALRRYRTADFGADLGAGLTVACVALPLAMAFGIASGVKPEQGLISAVVGGFLVAAFGGSRVQIGGPAGAFVALLYAIAERYGIANLLIATMMAGVLLIAMGALRLGQMVRYVPLPIVVGFTSGIAVVIALSQLKDFLGLEIAQMPANFFSQIATLKQHLDTINLPALGLGAGALALLFLWPKPGMARPAAPPATSAARIGRRLSGWLRRVPGPHAVLGLATLLVITLELPVETIGARFGGIPQTLPPVQLPAFDWSTAQNLMAPTLSIAFLGAIESLLCARVADGMTGDRHDPNQELIGQGIANCVAPLFGGIAVTGTIARTVTNIRAGARTPIAGMVHSLALLGFMLLLAPLAVHIPMSVLAAILLFVAYNMGEWHAFRRLRYFSNNYRVVMIATFLLTVVFDLTVAVQIGLLLSSLLFIIRISALTRLEPLPLPPDLAQLPDGRRVGAWGVFGSLFFGSTGKLEALQAAGSLPDVVVLELHQVIHFDSTGLDALRGLKRRLRQQGGRLILVAPNEQPLSLMRRT